MIFGFVSPHSTLLFLEITFALSLPEISVMLGCGEVVRASKFPSVIVSLNIVGVSRRNDLLCEANHRNLLIFFNRHV